MPFDGVVTKAICNELTKKIVDGRIEKIFQPENDEIILQIRANTHNIKLLLSANTNFPRTYMTNMQKENPLNPPAFCMLLRKHLVGSRILKIEFLDFERVIIFHFEKYNEFSITETKKVILEIMGRQSNIILTDSKGIVIDSIKRVNKKMNSVRTIQPGVEYSFPPSQEKISPKDFNPDTFLNDDNKQITVYKYILDNIKGFSPLLCKEICYRANIKSNAIINSIDEVKKDSLINEIKGIIETISSNKFQPCIIFKAESLDEPMDYHCIKLLQAPHIKLYKSISNALDVFYFEKDLNLRLKQKKSSILKSLDNHINRTQKKVTIHNEILSNSEESENYRLFGELITANIHSMSGKAKEVSVLNYHSENHEYISIPLDETLSPQENAQRYFRKYSKIKKAIEHSKIQVRNSKEELKYLENVKYCLESSNDFYEIEEIKNELVEQNYIRYNKKTTKKRRTVANQPSKFISTSGFTILVGKNNKQNDTLTFKTATSNDLWLHAKNIPGSHVIIKCNNKKIPESTLLEAGILTAYHSKAKLSSNVSVDYTLAKRVKKPSGAKPGMVTYKDYKTIVVTPNKEVVKKLKAN